RERFGIGQQVETSLLGSMIALQSINVAASTIVGEDFPRRRRSQVGNPLYSHYQCGDGKWLCLGMMHPDRYWRPFCRAVGLEDLENDPRFATLEAMAEHGEELVAILDRLFVSRPRAEWLKLLDEKGDFNFAPVNEVDDLVHDPQVLANNYITDFNHPTWGPIKVVGIPVKFSRTPGSLRRAAPEFGQHTEDVLLEIGYSWEEIERLRAEEVL
ncbi:MAG: CoA transferase, partial [Chloroflexota bacterium]|nr:CoA transferase [Chloroflexota bacterium]